jgi:plastocyanin
MVLPRRSTRIAGLLLGAALVGLFWVGSVYATPAPSGVHAEATTSVTISVGNDFYFTPSSFEVNPGDNVTITLESLGTQPHTFTLSPISNWTFASSNTTSDLNAFFQKHAPLVNLNVTGTVGAKVSQTFRAPAAGVYEFVCLQTGHFQAGMFGVMGSGIAVGPPGETPIPVALYIIVGVIVGLVVIAIVLGFVIGKREGSKYEMPPERLGYPEPRDPAQNPPGPPRPPTGMAPPPVH